MRLRTALVKSKNLVSVRILQAISPQYAQDYMARFGFDPKLHPPYLTMALGAGNDAAADGAGLRVFANGGYRVRRISSSAIEDNRGNVLLQAKPAGGGGRPARDRPAQRLHHDQHHARRSAHGTAARAMKLGRQDLAGKTGTTNDFIDAWFCGFNRNLVAVAWIGFDTPQTLGRNETGGLAALPIWMGYMGAVLKGVPEQALTPPAGWSPRGSIRRPARAAEEGKWRNFDFFYQEFLPPRSRRRGRRHEPGTGRRRSAQPAVLRERHAAESGRNDARSRIAHLAAR